MAPHNAALIVVDFQYDFCPPDGALAVKDALDLVSTLNSLLALPFALKIATRDFHPQNHISFASSHSPPDNIPFESSATVTNPANPSEKQSIRLWPEHCVQGTRGASLHDDLDASAFDFVVDKATDPNVEMLSPFASAFEDPPTGKTDLADRLRRKGITDVFIVGLATDYCVKSTALGAAAEGFNTCIISEAVKGIDDGAENIARVRNECAAQEIKFVALNGPEVSRIRDL